MARYMLDTDTCSYIMKRSSQAVLNRTNNTAEFGRVKGLTLENWTLPGRRSRSTADEYRRPHLHSNRSSHA